jgi:hypothetical protein
MRGKLHVQFGRRTEASAQARLLRPDWLQRGWDKEKCCKSGLESGAISGWAGVDGRPSGVLPIKLKFHMSSDGILLIR